MDHSIHRIFLISLIFSSIACESHVSDPIEIESTHSLTASPDLTSLNSSASTITSIEQDAQQLLEEQLFDYHPDKEAKQLFDIEGMSKQQIRNVLERTISTVLSGDSPKMFQGRYKQMMTYPFLLCSNANVGLWPVDSLIETDDVDIIGNIISGMFKEWNDIISNYQPYTIIVLDKLVFEGDWEKDYRITVSVSIFTNNDPALGGNVIHCNFIIEDDENDLHPSYLLVNP